MCPFIVTPWWTIPTFPVFVVLGVLAFICVLHLSLKKVEDYKKEEEFILFRLIASAGVAWFFAALFDTFFKYLEYGVFRFQGITFYGGLIGGVFSMSFLLKNRQKRGKTKLSTQEWFDKLILPLLSFHFFGRLGCFFGGCCYGKITHSALGVVFPDNAEYGVVHNGVKRYPTQLFEAVLILIIFLTVLFVKNRSTIYLFMYSTGRFIIEFFRGDDRGYLSSFLSPAQILSVFIFIVALILLITSKNNSRKSEG